MERIKNAWCLYGPKFVVATVIVLIIAALIPFIIITNKYYNEKCESLGGHPSTLYGQGVSIDSNGKLVNTTTTTTVCLSPEGGIINV